ncbi:acetyl-CoA acetyltransferase [Variovorax terrae]|uniref:Acetyl-CoA acetyltransferase n=1 Tax=Variovorax terrae TaxID=2923278 RepID=A0A9X2AM50_9BURK|nr:acetyl-CoA acetyltransferase [Variovorax terrae]MCJ0762365.1 acetyl-CoA acetyltransferase [Variovorax terrae]
MSANTLRGAAAIVGVAESDLGEVSAGTYPLDLAAQASVRALQDAGLKVSDVDAIFSVARGRVLSNLDLGEYLGIRPRIQGGSITGGSSALSHLLHAAMALAHGQCDVALIAYGGTPRADAKRNKTKSAGVVTEDPDLEAPYAPRGAATAYAMAAMRHMHQYGTTREQLAQVAISAREWARLNPVAWSNQKPSLTTAQVLDSKMISSPLTVADCCLVTDGGGAIVLTRSDHASALRRKPVHVLGVGEAQWHRWISQMADLTVTAATDSGKRAFEMAGLAPRDVDVVQLYDAFTINPILFLEDLGFCPKGEGGRFVEDGKLAPGGALPMNTNGGGLSYGHPGMYGIFTLIEATRQLRGEANARQVSGCEVALAHGNGGWLSSQVTALLGTSATL